MARSTIEGSPPECCQPLLKHAVMLEVGVDRLLDLSLKSLHSRKAHINK